MIESSLKTVIENLSNTLDQEEKLTTNIRVSHPSDLYSSEKVKTSALEFYLGENLYATLNVQKGKFYVTNHLWDHGKREEIDINDPTLNRLLSSFFRSGNYEVSTTYANYLGGGSVHDPYSAEYDHEYGLIDGIPVPNIKSTTRAEIEYEEIKALVEKAKDGLKDLRAKDGILVSEPRITSSVPRGFDDTVKKIYPMGMHRIAFTLAEDGGRKIEVALKPGDNTYSVTAESLMKYSKGILDTEINEMLEQIFKEGKYKLLTYIKNPDLTLSYKGTRGKKFEEISHKPIQPVIGIGEQTTLSQLMQKKKDLEHEAEVISRTEELIAQEQRASQKDTPSIGGGKDGR